MPEKEKASPTDTKTFLPPKEREVFVMLRTNLEKVFGTKRPILGMLHLPPLPGSPMYAGCMTKVIEHALRDADTLVTNGISSMIVENLGDYPYYPETTEPETVAAMTRVALEVRRKYPDMPIGINILRNSWKAALAVASLAGCQYIRLNVLSDTMITDQGMLNAPSHLAARYRKAIGAENVMIFADIYCKHGAPVVERKLATVAHEMVERHMADALIVDGTESAYPASPEKIAAVRGAAPNTPIFLGSGITVATADLVRDVDGCVFGFGTKPSGDMNDPVDGPTVKAFMTKIKAFS